VIPEWAGIGVECGWVKKEAGIYAVPTAMSTLSTNGNHIRNVGMGIKWDFLSMWTVGGQYIIDSVGSGSNVTLSDNVIRCQDAIKDESGLLWVSLIGCVLQGFTLQGNNVRHRATGSTYYGIHVSTDYGTGQSFAANKNNMKWSVQGNVALAPSGGGSCKASWDNGARPEEGSVMGNINEDCADPNNDFSGTNWQLDGAPAPLTGFIQTLNLVT
jgi:hypothetical protein